MAFTHKKLQVQFELAQGSFGEGKNNVATTSGLRTSFTGTYPGGTDQGSCEVAVYGIPLSIMNQLSTTGTQLNQKSKNNIAVFAGEEGGQMSVVYQGTIIAAFVDAAGMPEVAFRVMGAPGTYQAVKPVAPLSIKGSADVSGMLKGLAGQMGFAFEDAGVSVKLANPYHPGTAWQQALSIARAANIDITYDRGTMAIVPPNKARAGEPVLISQDHNMIGYPAFNQAGVVITALYDPAVKHYGSIKVQSELTSANGTWKIKNLTLELESEVTKGKWHMVLECVTMDGGTS